MPRVSGELTTTRATRAADDDDDDDDYDEDEVSARSDTRSGVTQTHGEGERGRERRFQGRAGHEVGRFRRRSARLKLRLHVAVCRRLLVWPSGDRY